MNKLLVFIKLYLVSFIKVQILATIVSFPILVYWGMPISYMTIVGNFIFSPVLTLFLVLSSIIFFTELFYIPNALFVSMLTIVTSSWDYLLCFGSKKWLIGFAQPDRLITFMLCFFVVLLFFRVAFRIISKFLLGLIVVVALMTVTGYWHTNRWPKENKKNVVHCTDKKLSIIQLINKTIKIVDDGFFNRKKSPENFVSFELKPYLLKKYGTTDIENIVLNKPSIRSFRAAQELCETFTVYNIFISPINMHSDNYLKSFFALQQVAQTNSTHIMWVEKS